MRTRASDSVWRFRISERSTSGTLMMLRIRQSVSRSTESNTNLMSTNADDSNRSNFLCSSESKLAECYVLCPLLISLEWTLTAQVNGIRWGETAAEPEGCEQILSLAQTVSRSANNWSIYSADPYLYIMGPSRHPSTPWAHDPTARFYNSGGIPFTPAALPCKKILPELRS